MNRSVKEVLACHSAKDLAEWQAFERVYGPIDSSWRDDQLAQVNVLLQQLILAWSDGSSEAKVTPVVMPSGLYADYLKRVERGEID